MCRYTLNIHTCTTRIKGYSNGTVVRVLHYTSPGCGFESDSNLWLWDLFPWADTIWPCVPCAEDKQLNTVWLLTIKMTLFYHTISVVAGNNYLVQKMSVILRRMPSVGYTTLYAYRYTQRLRRCIIQQMIICNLYGYGAWMSVCS